MKKEIFKGNKLIAQFMGVRPKLESPDVYTYNDLPYISLSNNNPEKLMFDIILYSKYHCSFDWLMPVVQKCISLSKDNSILLQYAYSIEKLYIETLKIIKNENRKQIIEQIREFEYARVEGGYKLIGISFINQQ